MSDSAVEKRRAAQRAYHAKLTTEGNEIGPIPAIADLDRRESCRFDLMKFGTTYHFQALRQKCAPFHYDLAERLQECILQDALYAVAIPRGSGKTTWCKIAIHWAVSYGHRRYPFFIGANEPKANAALDSIKMWIRTRHKWGEDFPEISIPIRCLEGKAIRANGQTCEGMPTFSEYSADRLVFATVPPPPNALPCDIGKSGFAIQSGVIFGKSGLLGEGIRGSVRTTATGEEIRPDVALGDDPQTDESAANPLQSKKRYEVMTQAVLGMGSPDGENDISLIVPCTVIRKSDLADQLLDRAQNPLFRGKRTKLLASMPTNMKAWSKYFEVHRNCALLEPPDYTAADGYYREHRTELDEGAVATWPERKKRYVSAIQYAMTLYMRSPKAFYAEYQNDPEDPFESKSMLSLEDMRRKYSDLKKYEVPTETQKLTCFIDVQKECFFYSVFAWEGDGTGHCVCYNVFPAQSTMLFTKASLTEKLADRYPQSTTQGLIRAGLKDLLEILFNIRWHGVKREVAIDRIGIDARFQTTTIRKLIRALKDNRISLCMGRGIKPTEKPFNHPDNVQKWTTEGRRLGHHWRIGDEKTGVKTVEVDTNFWKTYFHDGLSTELGDPGSISLFRPDVNDDLLIDYYHELIASHWNAETKQEVTGRYGKVDIWEERPERDDNDLLDSAVGNCVLANIEGIMRPDAKLEEETNPHPPDVIDDLGDWL